MFSGPEVSQPESMIRRRLTMAITELDIGGAERAFVRVAIGLKQRGWNVRVISLRDAGPLAGELRQSDIEVTALGCGGFSDIRAVWRMQRVLRRQCPDVLLTFLHQANIVGRAAGRWAKVPRIISGIRVADRRWSVGFTERLTSRWVDHYVAVGQTVADVHAGLCRLSDDRISVIRNGVDVAAIDATPAISRTQLECTEQDVIVLCVGRLTEQKAPDDVLSGVRCLTTIPLKLPRPVKLLFIGNGPLRSMLENRIAEYGLQESVRILGHRADVISIMKAANALILASRWEGFPNVILEAQAAGLPVIATSVDGCTEQITDRQTGRLFEPGSVQQLAEILSELIRTPESFSKLAVMARLQVMQKFRWEDCIAGFEQVLRGQCN